MRDLKPGTRMAPLRVTPDRSVPVRYAGASLDFNPIHVDDEAARAVGFPGRILHGLWTMAQAARMVQAAAGGDPAALRSISGEFRSIVVADVELEVDAVVGSPSDGMTSIDFEVRQGDRTVIRRGHAQVKR